MIRGDFHPPDMAPDYTIGKHWVQYVPDDHAVWHELFERQSALLPGRACNEYLEALDKLQLNSNKIPDLERTSALLEAATGWKLVIVPGLIPTPAFHAHLAERRFPVTWWVRPREKMDYLKEPDLFHDLFGHVPLLAHPVFADYIQAFGRGGVKAATLNASKYITRLYWFTVEFGLIRTREGLRIYGSGIVSSKTESVYCLESSTPHRLAFDLKRAMRTKFSYDDLQKTYFVIDDFQQLFDATKPDFTPIYEEIRVQEDFAADALLPTEMLILPDNAR